MKKFLVAIGIATVVAILALLPVLNPSAYSQWTWVRGGANLWSDIQYFASPILLPKGTGALPSLAAVDDADTGLFWGTDGSFGLTGNGAPRHYESGSYLRSRSDGGFGWSSTTDPSATMDISLSRGGASGTIRVASGTAPTCTGNCGTSPSIAGNNTNMSVTIGTSPPVAANFTVTFNGTWTTAPNCIAQRATTGVNPLVSAVVTTTTTAVVSLNANLVASEKFTIICLGP